MWRKPGARLTSCPIMGASLVAASCDKSVYGNFSFSPPFLSDAAQRRLRAITQQPPPVLCAITGSASSKVLHLTWHRPAPRYDHNNMHEILWMLFWENEWVIFSVCSASGQRLKGILWCRNEGERLVVKYASRRLSAGRWWNRADICVKSLKRRIYRDCPGLTLCASFCTIVQSAQRRPPWRYVWEGERNTQILIVVCPEFTWTRQLD